MNSRGLSLALKQGAIIKKDNFRISFLGNTEYMGPAKTAFIRFDSMEDAKNAVEVLALYNEGRNSNKIDFDKKVDNSSRSMIIILYLLSPRPSLQRVFFLPFYSLGNS